MNTGHSCYIDGLHITIKKSTYFLSESLQVSFSCEFENHWYFYSGCASVWRVSDI